jgi:two-component system, NarL family, sensor kinase
MISREKLTNRRDDVDASKSMNISRISNSVDHSHSRLEEQSAFLSALIEHSPVAIVTLDSEHHVQTCNPAFEQLFRYSLSELVSGNLEDLIATKENVPEAVSIWQRVIRGEKVYACTKRRRKDGSVVDVEIHGIPLVVKGRLLGVYGIYHDISEQKDAETEVRQLSGRILKVQDEERRRLARELHETTAQSLVALTMNLSQLRQLIGETTPEIDNLMADSMALAEHSVRETRTVSHLLHPPLLDDVGLASAVSWYARGFEQRSGIRVNLEMPKRLRRMSRELETTLFRVLQEGLTNIHRHSGSAVADIRITLDPNSIKLEIRDYGRGMPVHSKNVTPALGVGILGMRERLTQLNGRLEIFSTESGTTLWATLPRLP